MSGNHEATPRKPSGSSQSVGPSPSGSPNNVSLFLVWFTPPGLSRVFSHQTQRKLGNNMLLGVGPNPPLKGFNSGWQVLLSPPSPPSTVLPADA